MHGQSVTDSVFVPVKWLKEGMKDIMRGDACKEENTLLKSSILTLRRLSDKNEQFANEQGERAQEMRLRWNECMKQSDILQANYDDNIENLNKQIRKQKIKASLNIFGGATAGLVLGVITGLLIFK